MRERYHKKKEAASKLPQVIIFSTHDPNKEMHESEENLNCHP
jgi:hypothetical protein